MSCKFSEVGCDITASDHEEKRPIKHLTLLNDQMRIMQREFEKVGFQAIPLFSKLPVSDR